MYPVSISLLLNYTAISDVPILVKQVGFFKKNPVKRSAAVYLLCVCLSFSVSRNDQSPICPFELMRSGTWVTLVLLSKSFIFECSLICAMQQCNSSKEDV